ncbi:MAG: helix-turn-helix transcriptional regulator [Butyricimonas faecalis]
MKRTSEEQYMLEEMQNWNQVCFINYVIERRLNEYWLKPNKISSEIREIFKLAMRGKDNEEIARLLGVSENYIKNQKKIAYKKVKTKNSGILMLFLLLNQTVGK